MRLKIAHPIHFITLGVLLTILGFWRLFGWGGELFSREIITSFGYWFTFTLVGLTVIFLSQTVRIRHRSLDRLKRFVVTTLRHHGFALGAIVVLSVVLHSNEPHRFRTMNDEYALLSTSQMAHKYKTVAIPNRMIPFDNQPLHIGNHSDIRLPLFSVLTSFVHDLSGYRPNNVFLVNFFLTPVFLALLYALVFRAFKSRKMGILAILLAFSTPLLAQVATSGGYDLLNVALIMSLALIALSHAERPTPGKQTLLIYTGLLLAYCRYESVLYLVVAAFLIARNWIREGQANIRLADAVSPVFLIMPIGYNLYYTSLEAFRAPKTGNKIHEFFSPRYFTENLGEAVDYFFFHPITSSTSVLVAVLGLIGVANLLAHLLTHGRTTRPSSFVISFSPVIFVVFSVLILILFNYWGQLTDYQAVRFALPVFMGMIPVIAWFFHHNKLTSPKHFVFWFALTGIYCVAFTLPSQSQHHTTNSMIPSFAREFATNYARERGTDRTLFVSKATLGIIAYDRPAIPITFADAHPDRLIDGYRYGHYDYIFTDQILSYDRDLEAFTVNSSLGALGEDYRVETILIERYSPLLAFRIARVVAIRNSEGEWIDITKRPAPVFETERENPLSLELFKKIP